MPIKPIKNLNRVKIKYIPPVAAIVILMAIVKSLFSPDSGEEVSYLTETVRRGSITKTVNATGEVAV